MEKFLQSLALRLLDKIPGVEAHSAMAPFPERLQEKHGPDTSLAAVMIVLMKKDDKICFPLIQRNPISKQDPHKGQIALPGGRKESSDHNLAFTALRETEEEIGISASSIQIIGSLSPLYIPVSKNLVHPYIGWTSDLPEYKKQESEIHEIFDCNISEIINEKNLQNRIINTSYAKDLKVPGYLIDEKWIWGATAMILSEFRQILNELEYSK